MLQVMLGAAKAEAPQNAHIYHLSGSRNGISKSTQAWWPHDPGNGEFKISRQLYGGLPTTELLKLSVLDTHFLLSPQSDYCLQKYSLLFLNVI